MRILKSELDKERSKSYVQESYQKHLAVSESVDLTKIHTQRLRRNDSFLASLSEQERNMMGNADESVFESEDEASSGDEETFQKLMRDARQRRQSLLNERA